MTDLTEAEIAAAKEVGRIAFLEERVAFLDRTLRMSVGARSRTEHELGETRHSLRQAEILAERYMTVMCAMVRLADACPDIPQEVALVVQEARAVARCDESPGQVQ